MHNKRNPLNLNMFIPQLLLPKIKEKDHPPWPFIPQKLASQVILFKFPRY